MIYDTNTSTFAPQQMPNTQGMFNTALANAQASADPRFNMKAMDRSGVSRGKGTAATAGIQAAQNLADGVAQAYQIPAQDSATNANNALQYQTNQENFGLGVSNIAMQNDYANALAALQRNQNVLQYQGNALGGLLGSLGNIGNANSWMSNSWMGRPAGVNSATPGSFGNYNGTYRF
jgi:hypothetical protein